MKNDKPTAYLVSLNTNPIAYRFGKYDALVNLCESFASFSKGDAVEVQTFDGEPKGRAVIVSDVLTNIVEVDFVKTPNPERTDRHDLNFLVRGITNEGIEKLRLAVKRWADNLDFAVTYSVTADTEKGPAPRVKATLQFPRSRPLSDLVKIEKRLIASTNRIKRLHKLDPLNQ